MEITNEQITEALKSMGSISENEEVKVVELDDTIKFNCKRCGKCCSGRSDIIINPYDVYRIAKVMNIKTNEVFEKYCEVHCGGQSGLPVVTLKEDERGLCPFLKFFANEGKFGCSINDSKPGACIMHPIGVVRSVNTETNEHSKSFIKVPSCDIHDTNVEIKVRDFIKPYLDNEECHEAGNYLLYEPTKYVDSRKFIRCFIEQDEEALREYFTEEHIEKVNSLPEFLIHAAFSVYMGSTLKAMYDMDTNKDFLSQVEKAKADIKESCFKMIAVFRTIDFDFSSGKLTEEDEKEVEGYMSSMEADFVKHLQECITEEGAE